MAERHIPLKDLREVDKKSSIGNSSTDYAVKNLGMSRRDFLKGSLQLTAVGVLVLAGFREILSPQDAEAFGVPNSIFEIENRSTDSPAHWRRTDLGHSHYQKQGGLIGPKHITADLYIPTEGVPVVRGGGWELDDRLIPVDESKNFKSKYFAYYHLHGSGTIRASQEVRVYDANLNELVGIVAHPSFSVGPDQYELINPLDIGPNGDVGWPTGARWVRLKQFTSGTSANLAPGIKGFVGFDGISFSEKRKLKPFISSRKSQGEILVRHPGDSRLHLV